MKQAITPFSNAIALQSGSHQLGGISNEAKVGRFNNLTPVFQGLYEELCGSSTILRLQPDATKQQVDTAYGTDVQMVLTRTAEFDAMVRNMIPVGIQVWQRERQPEIKEDSERERAITAFLWDIAQKDLPEEILQARAPLWMSADDHIMPVAELIPVLKERVKNGLLRLVRMWNSYFNSLVEKDVLGLIEWGNDTVCKYHFFTHEGAQDMLFKNVYEESKGGWRKGFEQIVNEYIHYTIRIEHHLTQAQQFTVKNYPNGLPTQAARFLDATPTWLRKHFSIIGGQLTQESIFRQKQGSEIIMEEPVMVYAWDPAISLGEYVLPIGWVKTDYLAFAKEQAVAAINRRRNLLSWIGGLTAAAIVIVGFWQFIRYETAQQAKAGTAEYNAYVKKNSAYPTFTVKVDEHFAFPKPYDRVQWTLSKIHNDGDKEFALMPGNSYGSFISGQVKLYNHNHNGPAIYYEPLNTYYGDIDLSTVAMDDPLNETAIPSLKNTSSGVYLIMHILKTTTNSVTYSISEVPEEVKRKL